MAGLIRTQQLLRRSLGQKFGVIRTSGNRSMATLSPEMKEAEAKAAAQGDRIRLLALMGSVPVALYIFWQNIEFAEEEVDPLAVSDPTKDNFITQFMRKHMHDTKADEELRNEQLRTHHTKMLAHIEKKRIPEYPRMPTYGRVFGKPQFDFGEKKLPNTMDD